MQYLVLECSLEPALELERRRARREETLKLLEDLGRRHARALRTPLDFSSGEVFQALVRDPVRIPDLLCELKLELHDETLHCGLGYGALSTPRGGRVRRMDGPCFDRAHTARLEARRGGVWTCVRGFDPRMDGVLDAQFRLLGEVQDSWKPKQRETIALMRRLGRRRAVARARGVLPSTVTRSLDGAFYDGARSVEEAIGALLEILTSDRIPPQEANSP